MEEETFILLWLATTLADTALLTYNAALSRPAYQSSVYSYYRVNGTWNANLANDGIHETHAFKDNIARCSASNKETSPWWAVDLGRPTTIYRVDFTNRDDGTGMQYLLILSCFHVCHSCADEIYAGPYAQMLKEW